MPGFVENNPSKKASSWWSTLQNGYDQVTDFAARTVDDVRNSEFAKQATEVAGQVSSLATGLLGSEENADGVPSKAVGWVRSPSNSDAVVELKPSHDLDQEGKKSLIDRSLKILNRGATLALDGVEGTFGLTEHVFSAGTRVVKKAIGGTEKTADDVIRTVNGLTGAVANAAVAVESTAKFANDYSLFSWVASAWAVGQVAKATFWIAAAGGAAIGGGGYIGYRVNQAIPNALGYV